MGIKCGGSKILDIPESLLKASKSICKIDTSSKLSSGFLIKLFRRNKDFFCLMTNSGIINKEMLEKKQEINFYYDNGKKVKVITLNSNQRYINDFLEMKLDIMIIEILPEDGITLDYFLLPNLDYMYDYSELINKEIEIIQNPTGKISYKNGIIKEINKNEFIHLAQVDKITSGSPIFLKNTIKVIGIYKTKTITDCEYYGDFIGSMLNFLNNFYEFRINFSEYKYYIGELKKEIPYGKGLLYNKNRNIKYEGEFIDGKYSGNGKLIYDNGNYYEGQFIDGLRHGQGIIYNKNNDIIYEGEFNKGNPEGKGKYIYDNGEYYIGEFKNGFSNGKGILYYKNDNIKYEGDFVEDKFEGEGKFIWENGNYYIGKKKNKFLIMVITILENGKMI